MKGINEIKQEKYIGKVIRRGNYIGTKIVSLQNPEMEELASKLTELVE